MIGKLIHFVFARLVPVLVLALAIFVGWLNTEELPTGTFFTILFPILRGQLPPRFVGHGRMPGTPEVPADMKPEPRPEHEMFVELPGGYSMPQVGLGMCCRPTAYDDVLVERTVLWFLLMGGRLIDGAHLYLNHEAIGKGIKEAMNRGVPREEIFITTKISPASYGYNKTKEVVPRYLKELGLDYIDLLLMHAPAPFVPVGSFPPGCKGKTTKTCRQDTWKALSELHDQGLIRNLGVSNFAERHLEDLEELDGVAPIATNQIQFNPWLLPEWMETVHHCQKKGIHITGYNSLGGNLQHHKAKSIETISALAKKHKRSVAQIMLRWTLQKEVVIIPGTGNPNYMRENLSIYNFELSDEEMKSIDSLRETEDLGEFLSVPSLD